MAKSFVFLLFVVGIGYSVGPQFMQALRRDGFKPILLAIVCCMTGLIVAIVIAKLLGLDPGLAAGLLSGSLTESPVMGTAAEAINTLPLPAEERARLVAHIAVADAVCCIFSTAGLSVFVSTIPPKMLGIDLKTKALNLEQQLGIKRTQPGVVSTYRRFELRTYRLAAGSPLPARSISDGRRWRRNGSSSNASGAVRCCSTSNPI